MTAPNEKGGRADQDATTHNIIGLGGTDSGDYVSAASPKQPAVEQLEDYEASGAEFIALNGKVPRSKGWRTKAAMTPIEAMEHMEAGGNVGIRLRPTHLVIDVDPRNFAEGDNPIGRLANDLSIDLGGYPRVVTGSGGSHYYMRLPEPMSVRNELPEYPGVEFKSHGRQVVSAGSVHPETGELYLWDEDPLAAPLGDAAPLATEALVELIRRPEAQSKGGEGGEVEPEQLEAMLEALSPEDYREHEAWLTIMMACHHATAGSGREQFIAWSVSDPEYAGHETNIEERWNSLRSDTSRRQVTQATLFKALADAGRCDLIPRPSAAEDFADVELEVLPERENTEKPDDMLIAQMNERFCAVLEGGDYRIYMSDFDEIYDPPRQVLTPLSRAAFRNYHENEQITLPDRRQPISIADYWLKHPKMRKYPGIVLDPSGKEKRKLNLWQGWGVQPKPGDWSRMRELIEDVLCAGNREHSEYVLKWIAFMLQKPGVQPQAAIAFRGNEGTGKGTLGRYLMELAGRHGMTVSSSQQLAGKFNAHLRNAVFVFADEALWPGNKESEGTLKQLVTEPVISFEPKGKDVMLGRNLVHLMLASNEEWVVPAGKDARRFAVFDVSDVRRNDHAFFNALHAQMRNGGLEAMLHDLLEMDLGDWHPSRKIPQTQALADQKLYSLDPASKFWMEALERGALGPFINDEWAGGPLTLGDERSDVLDDYDAFLKRNRIYSAKATSKALVEAGKAFGLTATKVDGNSKRGWIIPPLAEARASFEKRVGSAGIFG